MDNLLQASKQASKQARLNYIDLLKAISIFLVLITHLSWSNNERKVFLFPFVIEPGVPLFMMTSGYIAALNCKKSRFENLHDCYGSFDILRRVLTYSVPLVVIASTEVIIHNLYGENRYSFIKTIICGGIGPGSYYFPCLIQMVIFFPLIYVLVLKHKEAGLGICLLLTIVFELMQSFYDLNEGTYRLVFFRYLFCIGFGCYLFLNEEKEFKWYINLTAVLLGVGWLIATEYMNYNPKLFYYWTSTNVFADLYIAYIFKKLISLLKNVRVRFMEYIGRKTYYIFLVQMFFFSGINVYLYRMISNRFLSYIIVFVICIFSGIIYSMIITPITTICVNKLIYFANEFVKKYNSIDYSRFLR